MNSAIYEGWVRHRRYTPKPHAFRYALFMTYLDLEEIAVLSRPGGALARFPWVLGRFHRPDYLGDPRLPLDTAVRERVELQGLPRPNGPIRMLTHLRYWGYCFNPVTFYYCFDSADQRLECLVAEITNTPWGERHAYVLGMERHDYTQKINPTRDSHHDLVHRENLDTDIPPHASPHAYRFPFTKTFHISPFMDMEVMYDWRFLLPAERLVVHMTNTRKNAVFFDATLSLGRQELNARRLAWTALRYPWMTGKVMGAIYWEAFRLWLKGCPYYPHPIHSQQGTKA